MKNKILILMVCLLAFCCSSCRVQKSHKETSVKSFIESDSLIHLEITKIDTVKIEAEELEGVVPLEELKKGKPFIFRSKKGRAHASLVLVNDTVKITSNCDYLEKYVLSTEIYIKETRSQISEFKQIIEDQKTIIKSNWFYKFGFFGMLILNALLLLNGIWKKFNIKNTN